MNSISDISPLKGLTKLRKLEVYLNPQLTDISPLENLTNLYTLDLGDDRITDISPLKKLTNLHILWLGNNSISEISPLVNMTNMVELYLYGNSIKNVSALRNMSNLKKLQLSGNPITDYSPLSGLEKLTDCDVAYKIPSTPMPTKTPTPTPKVTPTPTPHPKDTKAPVIESFQCTPDSVMAPSTVKVTADISDDVGVRSAEVTLLFDTQYVMSAQMTYNKSTSLWEATLSLHRTIRAGSFNLEITAYDKSAHEVEKTYSRALKITNPNQDTTALVVSGVAVSPKPVQVSSSVKISAEITDNLQKITYVECFVLYNGVEKYDSQMTLSSTNQWMCRFNISNSAQIGSYSVRIYAEDNNGNHTNATFNNVMSVCAETSSTPTPATTTTPTPEKAIAFPSDLVEEAVRNVIGKESGEVYPSDVKAVIELTLASTKCDDIASLTEFKGLTTLDLANDPSVKNTKDNQITDLSPLQGLTKLRQLFLTRNEISDLTPLQGLISLTTLHFGGNQVSDLTALKALTGIQSLHIWGNEITDLSPLQEMLSPEYN